MHAQPLRHLVLVEVELLARDEKLFAEGEFGMKCGSDASC